MKLGHYPFTFHLGDRVRVLDGHNKGKIGNVQALELSRRRRIAILRHIKPDGTTFRECESNLSAVPQP